MVLRGRFFAFPPIREIGVRPRIGLPVDPLPDDTYTRAIRLGGPFPPRSAAGSPPRTTPTAPDTRPLLPMKSEEKHRLQENELERLGQSFAKWLEQHGLKVLAGVCGLLVVLAIGFYVWRSWSDASSRGWGELRTALATNNPEELKLVAASATHENTVVGAWARLHESELRLQDNLYQQFVERSRSDAELGEAITGFKEVSTHPAATAEMRERALYGLASAQEATSNGDNAEAIATYKLLLRDFPKSIYQPIVERRIDVLESDEGQAFYTFFQKQQPAPDDPIVLPDDDRGDTGAPLGEIPADLELLDPKLDGPALGTPDDTKPGDDPAETDPTGTSPEPVDPKPIPDDPKPVPDDTAPKTDTAPKPDETQPDPADAKSIPDDGPPESAKPEPSSEEGADAGTP
jgi:hypothetical protein